MGEWRKSPRSLRVLLPVGVSVAALLAVSEGPIAQMAEIDSYDYAVSSGSKERALAFIREFSSSHLVGDLIESLPPEVGQQVCTELHGSGPAKARKACETLRAAATVQTVSPAAGITVPAAPVAPVTVTPVEPSVFAVPVPAATAPAAVSGFTEVPTSPDDEAAVS